MHCDTLRGIAGGKGRTESGHAAEEGGGGGGDVYGKRHARERERKWRKGRKGIGFLVGSADFGVLRGMIAGEVGD